MAQSSGPSEDYRPSPKVNGNTLDIGAIQVHLQAEPLSHFSQTRLHAWLTSILINILQVDSLPAYNDLQLSMSSQHLCNRIR